VSSNSDLVEGVEELGKLMVLRVEFFEGDNNANVASFDVSFVEEEGSGGMENGVV